MKRLLCVDLRGTDAAAVEVSWRGEPGSPIVCPWAPAAPEALVTELQTRVGPVREILLAIGPAFLHMTRVQLPPSGDAAREQMVQIEPDRFFVHPGALVTSLTPGGDLAFAVDAAWLDRVMNAFSVWAPVTRVEAAPLAFVSAMPHASGSWRLAGDDRTVVLLDAGVLRGVRRIPDASQHPRETVEVAPDLTTLTGLARRRELPLAGTVLPPDRRRPLHHRALRQAVTAAVAAVAALWFLGTSVADWRERTLRALQVEATRLETEAAGALEAHRQLALQRRSRELADSVLRTRPDPAAALAQIGDLLPPDASLVLARATGDAWQVDGTARDASALVPLLDAAPTLDNVRALAGSTRFRDGNRSRETFSIALEARRAP